MGSNLLSKSLTERSIVKSLLNALDNISWYAFLLGDFSSYRCAFLWKIPLLFGLVLFAVLYRMSSPPNDVSLLQNYVALTALGYFLIVGPFAHSSLRNRRLMYEHIKNEAVTLEEEEISFRQAKKEKEKGILPCVAVRGLWYAIILFFILTRDWVSASALVAIVAVDVLLLVAVFTIAWRMPPGRNALSLYDCSENEERIECRAR